MEAAKLANNIGNFEFSFANPEQRAKRAKTDPSSREREVSNVSRRRLRTQKKRKPRREKPRTFSGNYSIGSQSLTQSSSVVVQQDFSARIPQSGFVMEQLPFDGTPFVYGRETLKVEEVASSRFSSDVQLKEFSGERDLQRSSESGAFKKQDSEMASISLVPTIQDMQFIKPLGDLETRSERFLDREAKPDVDLVADLEALALED